MPSTGPHLDHAPSALPQSSVGPDKLPGIKHIIAVASGKDGVGKLRALAARFAAKVSVASGEGALLKARPRQR